MAVALTALVLAASCAAPEPPDAWAVERVTPTDDREEVSGVCEEVRALALGSHADEESLDATLDELARIAASIGATEALPLLSDVGAIADDEALTERQQEIRRHDLLVQASRPIDDATADACDIPVFSALYAGTGFPDCHLVLDIPIAAYTPEGAPGTCSADGRPSFLPCWSDDGDHLAVDCVTDEIVAAIDGRWQATDGPRDVEIDRTDPDAEPGPDLVVPIDDPACAGIADLFLGGPAPSGSLPDVDLLRRAVSTLGTDTRGLVDEVIDATVNPPSLDEFEALLSALDDRTASTCGLPLVSAWATLATAVDTLPCWVPTGESYPAYDTAPCPGD